MGVVNYSGVLHMNLILYQQGLVVCILVYEYYILYIYVYLFIKNCIYIVYIVYTYACTGMYKV